MSAGDCVCAGAKLAPPLVDKPHLLLSCHLCPRKTELTVPCYHLSSFFFFFFFIISPGYTEHLVVHRDRPLSCICQRIYLQTTWHIPSCLGLFLQDSPCTRVKLILIWNWIPKSFYRWPWYKKNIVYHVYAKFLRIEHQFQKCLPVPDKIIRAGWDPVEHGLRW